MKDPKTERPAEFRASHSSTRHLLIWSFVLLLIVSGFALLGPLSPEMQILLIASIGGTLTLSLLILKRRAAMPVPVEEEEKNLMPDAASPEEQHAALQRLGNLPHMRRLRDGTLFDYCQGSIIEPCDCGQYSPLHLVVRYGKGRKHDIALVSRDALGQYVALQESIAGKLSASADGASPSPVASS